MFYLASMAKLPSRASKDLIDVVGAWGAKTQNNKEDVAGASVL
jgi:hypothetical protein